MNWLRDEMIPVYEQGMAAFCQDPWAVRDEYIWVILNRSRRNTENFFRQDFMNDLSKHDEIRIFKLLEMQRHAMLMYTSCGWFFDDIGGIEAIQILRYAARAIELARESEGIDLESRFMKKLESAPANVAINKNGSEIYRRFARRNKVTALC